jgi:hemolysin III
MADTLVAGRQIQSLRRKQTLGEEIANSVSHGIGALLGIAATVILAIMAAQKSDPWGVVGFSVYGASLIFLFLNSTIYHAIAHPKAKHILRILDHVAIYVLIAGTYTPICITAMRGPWGFTLFGLIWGFAIAGIVLQSVRFGKHPILSTAVYVAMGWLIIIAIKPMHEMVPYAGQFWLITGGIFYTAGVAFFAFSSRVKYFHFIWHLFVLGGAVCHFFTMLTIAAM